MPTNALVAEALRYGDILAWDGIPNDDLHHRIDDLQVPAAMAQAMTQFLTLSEHGCCLRNPVVPAPADIVPYSSFDFRDGERLVFSQRNARLEAGLARALYHLISPRVTHGTLEELFDLLTYIEDVSYD